MGAFRTHLLRVLAGLPLVSGLSGAAWAADEQDRPSTGENGEVIVYGVRAPEIFAGIFADTELDENDIAAYGFDTIGDLIDEVSSEVDPSGEGPVILINGR